MAFYIQGKEFILEIYLFYLQYFEAMQIVVVKQALFSVLRLFIGSGS